MTEVKWHLSPIVVLPEAYSARLPREAFIAAYIRTYILYLPSGHFNSERMREHDTTHKFHSRGTGYSQFFQQCLKEATPLPAYMPRALRLVLPLLMHIVGRGVCASNGSIYGRSGIEFFLLNAL